MRVFFNAIIVQLLLSGYVLWRGWNALPPKKYARVPFAAIFVAELVMYLAGFLFVEKMGMPYIHYVAWIGTSWMIFILYMSTLLLGYDFLRFVNKKKRILPEKLKLGSLKNLRIFYFLSFILVVSVMSWGYYQFKNPTITHHTVDINKKSKIDKLRIVMVSDLHAGYLIKKDIISMYVDKIMEQKPDVILLVGDIIDYDIASVKEQSMEEEFKRLKAPYGVFASTGNHEYIGISGETLHEKVTWQSEYAKFSVLRDSTVLIDSAFYIVGREDDKYEFRKPLADLMDSVDMSLPIILMNHQPHNIREASEHGIDLAFYGHTHNGQLFPNNLLVKMIWEMSYGYKQIDNSHVYVSSGLGLAGPQYRIGTVSEIVVFDVNFNK